MSVLVQYIIAFIIIIAAVVWIILRLIKFKNNKDNGDCGCCANSDACKVKELNSLRRKKSEKCDLKN